MEAQMNAPTSNEVQVYKNDYLSGMILLMKRLFML